MMESIRRIQTYFGITGLDFRLDQSRQRVLWASLLPFVLLCAMLISLSLDLYFDQPSPPLGAPSDGWQRVQNGSDAIGAVLAPLCLAALVLSGVSRWSRAEASWMLVVGLSLIIAAAAATTATTVIRTVELDPLEQIDLRVFTWSRWAANFGVVGAGYCFVAYRGLAASQTRRRVLRRGPPQL